MDASVPLKKQLWQQTVKAKIKNQAALLGKKGKNNGNLCRWVDVVKSGDNDNLEGRAAVYYWKNLFTGLKDHEGKDLDQFIRHREGDPPNKVLNYGYAILRAITARSLVGSGLLPTLGIFHRNQYNAYCLADDIMEPYRPYVDELVYSFLKEGIDCSGVDTKLKKELLSIPTRDVWIEGEKSPLMIGMQRTTASLVKCFEGHSRKILYPELV